MTDRHHLHNTCPSCQTKGKRVPDITLKSLLRPECIQRIGDGPWLFCDSADCDVVYFNAEGQTFNRADLTVRVGVKETSGDQGPRHPRLVCYCFNHTIESIEQEVRQTGRSTVLDDIKTRMKDGCWCETKNPQGSCCLGTVGRYVKRALADHGHTAAASAEADTEQDDCCAGGGHAGNPVSGSSCCAATGSTSNETTDQAGGLWAVTVSAGAAVVASACCWLPLLLLTLGVSSAGVGGVFATLRPYLLAVAAVSLGLGFYLAYRRPACAPGSACAAQTTTRRRGILWLSAVFVIAMALFPYYGGVLLYGGQSSSGNNGISHNADGAVTSADNGVTSAYMIEGMTCRACAVGLQARLARLPGVTSAKVSYDQGTAWVTSPPGQTDEQAVHDAVKGAGYSVIPGDGKQAESRPATSKSSN